MSEPFKSYYESAGGRRVARLLARIVAPAIRRSSTARLLAVGHPGPLLTGLDPAKLERLAVAMTGEPRLFPPGHPSCALIAAPESLPFAESMFDQALVIHALEFAERPAAMLRELWRVLAPASELVLVVPNRAGLWTHFEATPFGQGRPWGRNELMQLLRDAMFEPVSWRSALVAPPVKGLGWLDRPLTRVAPRLGGIHFVLARKTDGLAPIGPGRLARATLRPAEA